jgi:hypothetical protein
MAPRGGGQLAGCRTTGPSTGSCAEQDLVEGTAEYAACMRVDGERYKLWNRAYGNCGHCAGGAGR